VRILFIHEVNYLTKPIYEMHEFPEHLAAMGHKVAFWHFPEGMTKHQVSELGWKKVIPGRVMPDSEITLYTPQNSTGSLLGRLKTACLATRTARTVIRDFEPDLVVSFSVPTSGWQALRVAKSLGVPYLFRALDVSHKIRKGIFQKLIYWAERYVYRKADWVSCNNPAMAEYCKSMGALPRSTSVDWPPIDFGKFAKRSSSKELRYQLGIPSDAKVLLYMGSFFYFSGLPQAIKRFAEISSSEYLVLVGGGEQDSELRDLVRELKIEDRVLFTGFVPFAQLGDYLTVADVALNTMERSIVSNAAIPNKVIQYLATGLRVISTRLDGLASSFPDTSSLAFAENPSGVIDLALERVRRESNAPSGAKLQDLDKFKLEIALPAFEERCRLVARND
jgi:glycosyltransferase involved in cell wall biosynthesis